MSKHVLVLFGRGVHKGTEVRWVSSRANEKIGIEDRKSETDIKSVRSKFYTRFVSIRESLLFFFSYYVFVTRSRLRDSATFSRLGLVFAIRTRFATQRLEDHGLMLDRSLRAWTVLYHQQSGSW